MTFFAILKVLRKWVSTVEDNSNENGKSIIINRYDGRTLAILHNRSYFGFNYIFNGSCIENIGLNRINLQKGDIMVIAPDTIHSIEALNEDSVIFELLLKYDNFYEMLAPLMKGDHAINKFFAESLHDKNHIKCLVFHTGEDGVLQSNVIKMFEDQSHSDAYTDHFLTGCFLINFARVMREHRNNIEVFKSKRSNLPDDFLVMSYIQDNLATITLADVAKHFNFSMSHCSRLIKAATGHGFNEWKRILRLRRAQWLLKNTNYTIIEIANSLGYMNPENFIRIFRKEFNLTPTQYRKQFK